MFEERKVAENTTLTRKPSDVFRTNMWSTFWHERHGIRSRDEIGVDKIMYSVDYPHGTTTWPRSVWCRTHSLQDVTSAEERKMILMDMPSDSTSWTWTNPASTRSSMSPAPSPWDLGRRPHSAGSSRSRTVGVLRRQGGRRPGNLKTVADVIVIAINHPFRATQCSR